MTILLTVAGSDPTGGAGVQADLQVFASLGCHGCGVITAVTAQDARSVYAVHRLPPEWVGEQLACLPAEVGVGAVKTGMLGGAGVVEALGEALAAYRDTPLVVDPVLASTGGTPLLDAAGLDRLRELLVPRAALVTPNLREAEALTGLEVREVGQMRQAARRLVEMGARAALVKGGHLSGDAVDVLCVEGRLSAMTGPRLTVGTPVHGTGCALAAAAAVFLAQGEEVADAVGRAKQYVAAGLAAARPIGGAAVLDYRAAARAVTS